MTSMDRITPPISALTPWDDDSEALFACAEHGGALCTVTQIDGSWSRRLGAQLAVLPDGSTRGSLADGCLEKALAAEALAGGDARVLRYGAGSPFLDIRLPCGSGIEVMVDPAPDRAAVADACAALTRREPADLAIGQAPQGAFVRRFLPKLRLAVLGSGPEVTALARLARAQGIDCLVGGPSDDPGTDHVIALGRAPALPVDPWTAIAVLFHDHEWERSILPWALGSPACYVGAQGGRGARETREAMLTETGWDPADPRLRSPIGVFAHARTPSVLALSVLAEIVAEHEKLLDR
ncbi:MAG: XdhC family protein [Novosphingobium sp.]